MRYKRNEAFRYSFDEPLKGHFSIVEIDGENISVPEGHAEILDLSTNGLKFSTYLRIPTDIKEVVNVSVRFSLNKSEFKVNGKIMWGKQEQSYYIYGIQLFSEENLKDEIIHELKQYVSIN